MDTMDARNLCMFVTSLNKDMEILSGCYTDKSQQIQEIP